MKLLYPGLLFLLSGVVVGYNNGLARTPQMGWNTWNRFGCNIDETLIVESAKVVAEQLRVYGYECVSSSRITTNFRAVVRTFVDQPMCRYRDG